MSSRELRFSSIILAAGGSTRLGQPKQLLTIGGESLLRRAVRAAIDSGSETVVVVLGAAVERMAAELANLPVTIAHNPDWETGMASSLRSGLDALLSLPTPPDAAAVLLCDQPGLTAENIHALVHSLKTSDASAAVSRYENGAQGPPCLFAANLFPQLQALQGQSGARQVLAQLPANEIILAPFAEGSHDIDTPEDWKRFQQNHQPPD